LIGKYIFRTSEAKFLAFALFSIALSNSNIEYNALALLECRSPTKLLQLSLHEPFIRRYMALIEAAVGST
jgi:hypothetical protein